MRTRKFNEELTSKNVQRSTGGFDDVWVSFITTSVGPKDPKDNLVNGCRESSPNMGQHFRLVNCSNLPRFNKCGIDYYFSSMSLM